MYGNKISGTLPPELGALTALTSIYLNGGNKLTGTIPPTISAWTALSVLNLSSNNLSGTIPPEISELTRLLSLGLFKTLLSGTIPPTMSALTAATFISLANTKLTGSIPPEVANLNAVLLYMYNTKLTGSIPPEISKLTALSRLYLHNNKLTGSIPPEISKLTALTRLILYNNKLTGSIPSQISALTLQLHLLYVHNNKLTGSVPSAFGVLTNVDDFNVSNNKLTGVIPGTLTLLQKTVTFDIGGNPGLCRLDAGSTAATLKCGGSGIVACPYPTCACNYLESPCPSGATTSASTVAITPFYPTTNSTTCCPAGASLREKLVTDGHLDCETSRPCAAVTATSGKGTQLMDYDVDGNGLTSSIPPQVGQLTRLTSLSMMNNKVTGSIPAELSTLTDVRTLNLAQNLLTGNIAGELTSLALLPYLKFGGTFYLGGNDLCRLDAASTKMANKCTTACPYPTCNPACQASDCPAAGWSLDPARVYQGVGDDTAFTCAADPGCALNSTECCMPVCAATDCTGLNSRNAFVGGCAALVCEVNTSECCNTLSISASASVSASASTSPSASLSASPLSASPSASSSTSPSASASTFADVMLQQLLATAAAIVYEPLVDGCFPSDARCNAVVLAAVQSIADNAVSGGGAHTNPCTPVNPCQNGGVCADTTPVPAHTPALFSCACTRFFTRRVCTVPVVFVTSSQPPTISLAGQTGRLYGHGFTQSLRVVDIAIESASVSFNYTRYNSSAANGAGAGNRRLLLQPPTQGVYANEDDDDDDDDDDSDSFSEARTRRRLLADDAVPQFYWTATFDIPATVVEGYRPLNVSFANSAGISSWSSSALLYFQTGETRVQPLYAQHSIMFVFKHLLLLMHTLTSFLQTAHASQKANTALWQAACARHAKSRGGARVAVGSGQVADGGQRTNCAYRRYVRTIRLVPASTPSTRRRRRACYCRRACWVKHRSSVLTRRAPPDPSAASPAPASQRRCAPKGTKARTAARAPTPTTTRRWCPAV
jgi:Leucine-rich repeat (LRR) protein